MTETDETKPKEDEFDFFETKPEAEPPKPEPEPETAEKTDETPATPPEFVTPETFDTFKEQVQNGMNKLAELIKNPPKPEKEDDIVTDETPKPEPKPEPEKAKDETPSTGEVVEATEKTDPVLDTLKQISDTLFAFGARLDGLEKQPPKPEEDEEDDEEEEEKEAEVPEAEVPEAEPTPAPEPEPKAKATPKVSKAPDATKVITKDVTALDKIKEKMKTVLPKDVSELVEEYEQIRKSKGE